MTQQNSASLYKKIAKVMGELNVLKDGKNSHFNYAYFTADAVADAVRVKLADQNVAFFASIVGREQVSIVKTAAKTDPKTGEMTRTETGFQRWVVDFKFIFADGDSGEIQECYWSAEADAADDKGINKCATAAEKYFLLKTFIVSMGDEADADADGRKSDKQRDGSGKSAGVTLWTDDEVKLANFYKSANERFKLSRKTVDEVLAAFDAFQIADWRATDNRWAIAALVAHVCQGDPEKIDNFTAGMTWMGEKAAQNLCDKARQIARAEAGQVPA